MGRDEVIRKLLAGIKEPAYLEIGVQNGHTFHAVDAHRKVAVDPQFAFDVPTESAKDRNRHCEYHEVRSDDYFTKIIRPDEKFDLIFIDGLHTFDQTLRDLMSATIVLKDGGIIVVDDVMPSSFAASISDIGHFDRFRAAAGIAEGNWMGDVYRVIFFVRHFMPLFSFATVQENHGQSVLWRQSRPLDASLMKVETVSRLDYSDFFLNKNMFNMQPVADIKRAITAAHPPAASPAAPSQTASSLPEQARAPKRSARKIAYYFQALATEAAAGDDLFALIELHTTTFERHGWTVVHADENDARRHPSYEIFSKPDSILSRSINAWEYTRACYMRWLAYATLGLPFADFDVINYGFTPDDADALAAANTGNLPMLISSAGAMGLLHENDYQNIIQVYLGFIENPVIDGPLLTDINDMTIMRHLRPEWYNCIPYSDERFVKDYTLEGWEKAKLVHYPNGLTGTPRAGVIHQVRPPVA